MGYVRSNAYDWETRTSSYTTRSTSDIFRSSEAKPEYLPKNISIREARRSEVNPNPTPIMLIADVTGSMGYLAKEVVTKLPDIIKRINESMIVSDPQISIGAVGDVETDRYPFQITQFESGIALCDQAENLYIEGGGGGNHFESYDLPWLFAATKVVADLDERKGYIFTIGDEPPPSDKVILSYYSDCFGSDALVMKPSESFAEASKKFNVFHLIIENGGYCKVRPERVIPAWRELIGNNAILVNDVAALSDIIIAVISINEGLLTINDAINQSTYSASVKNAFRLID